MELILRMGKSERNDVIEIVIEVDLLQLNLEKVRMVVRRLIERLKGGEGEGEEESDR